MANGTQNDFRTGVVFVVFVATAFLLLLNNALTAFHVLPTHAAPGWRMWDRLIAVLGCLAMGAGMVLVSVPFGVRHFKWFSRLDRLLSRLWVGAVGAALLGWATFAICTKTYSNQRGLLGLVDGAAALVGAFLIFWVFLFFGRKNPERA